MRLKKLQVSGFKSFVDSTDIRLPGHLVGVVGPNGCGKSNVIDAVRWVMGESSAKMLRGDQMADVIFNGSASRKPVGKASVELVFDNSDGKAPGNYGQFAEISVKRTLTRDGHSTYFINNLKTRRKDVLDLFRGTGLGPRSYSIIEQGMVSRIVEARPEDLRAYVEEAAGTIKYKARRHETETRISHTRENLDRVADIRDELGKQLRRLKRQSASARRYKLLKQEERQINGQLQVLKLNALNENLAEQDRLTATHENTLQAALASQRDIEAQLESLRKQQSEAHEHNNQIQQAFYKIGANITNLEQRITHQNETQQAQKEELERLDSSKAERQEQIELDLDKGINLRKALETILPDVESLTSLNDQAETRLIESERILQEWLSEMESFNEESREPAQQVGIQKSRIRYLEQHLARAAQNKERLNQDFSVLKQQLLVMDIESLRQEVSNHDQKHEEAQTQFHRTEAANKALLTELDDKRASGAQIRTQQQEVISRLESLREIQSAALEGDNDALESWLKDRGFGNATKLAGNIKVSEGWERAADRVLNGFLSAICVDSISMDALNDQSKFGFSMISSANIDMPVDNSLDRISLATLLDKIRVENTEVAPLLYGIFVADNLDQALGFQDRLVGREYIVTREGAFVGANWINLASQSQLETGVLVREEEISQLEFRQQETSKMIETANEAVLHLEAKRDELDAKMKTQRAGLRNLRSDMSSLHNRLGREEAQYLEAEAQIKKLTGELDDLSNQIHSDSSEIENARALLETATEQSGSHEQQRAKLVERRDHLNTAVIIHRKSCGEATEKLHEKALEKQKIEAEIELIRENIKRLRLDIEQVNSRIDKIESKGKSPTESVKSIEDKLSELLEQKLKVDTQFSSSKDVAAGFDNRISHANSERSEQIEQVNQAREALDQQKLTKQEVFVRRDTHMESILEQGYVVEECAAELTAQESPKQPTIDQWQETLSEIERKIARIGPVNLVAIEEFDEESERMEYLDNQHSDLTEALETLESVIRKIDRETRSKFRETFDQINAGFNEFFPKLFGGGKAELYLTSDDWLTAGISVMARPPGKRNSSIHLLSGGEKALTAVALLFSLFKLHPAPFCMLDEVDAPLDDANVDRYCDTLKSLANLSQMIIVTHNKITMEAMELLVGVTMQEAGVSRLVSVDIDQAIEMAVQ